MLGKDLVAQVPLAMVRHGLAVVVGEDEKNVGPGWLAGGQDRCAKSREQQAKQNSGGLPVSFKHNI